MIENIAFLRETKCNFFSEPCAFDMRGNAHLAATKANTLVLTCPNNEKKSLSLAKHIKFDKKECAKLLRFMQADRLLVITNKFNVYLVELDMDAFDVLSVKSVCFRYAQSLNASTLSYNCLQECSGLWLMACGRFLFSLNAKTGAFALFKVFNDAVVDFCAHSTAKNQICVLTDKKLYSIGWESVNDVNTTKVHAQAEVSGFVSATSLLSGVALLHKSGSLSLHCEHTLDTLSTLTLNDASSQPAALKGAFTADGAHLTAYDSSYAYLLSSDLARVEQVTCIKHVHAFFAAGGLYDLGRKSENSVNLASYAQHAYTEDDKGPRYYSMGLEDRVDLAFAYMLKLFLRMKSVRAYKTCINSMMVELYLADSVMKHKRFKEKVLALFSTMKDFSVQVEHEGKKIYAVCPASVSVKRVGGASGDACGQGGSTSGVYDAPTQHLTSC